jgi:hypothetical protein
MGKSKSRSKSGPITHKALNKVLSVFISKASKPAPRLNEQQKAYIAECSCFILSAVAILYPEFAAKISPSSLEQLLSHFVSKCTKGTRSKDRMTGGTLSLRSASRKVGRFSIFPGAMVLIYALLLTRASVEQMNKQNPFRAGRYELFDLAKDELAKEDLLKETMMVEITRDNLMKWVTQPSMQLSEMTNVLSLKAIRIVGVVTRKQTEGLEQQVRDHCMSESAQVNLNLGLEPGTELTEYVAPIPESRWDTFKSLSWSTLSSLATSADQIADRIAKTHLNANTLFDMPGCIGRVNELKFQELMDQMKHEHARIKLDIDMWMKKGLNDIAFIFSLFRIAIGMILTSLGYTLFPKNNNTRKGRNYNITENALQVEENSPPLMRQPSLGPQIRFPQLPASRPYLQMPQLAEEQPYIQRPFQIVNQDMQRQNMQGQAQTRALENAQIKMDIIRKAAQEAQQRAAEARVREAEAHAREMMEQVVGPANRVAKKRSAEAHARENAAQRRQENFAELLRRTNSLSKKLRSVK